MSGPSPLGHHPGPHQELQRSSRETRLLDGLKSNPLEQKTQTQREDNLQMPAKGLVLQRAQQGKVVALVCLSTLDRSWHKSMPRPGICFETSCPGLWHRTVQTGTLSASA